MTNVCRAGVKLPDDGGPCPRCGGGPRDACADGIWNEAIEKAAKVADADAEVYRKRLDRAKKRYANRELLSAVGYQGDPDAECIDLEACLQSAESIAAGIRTLKEVI